MKQRLTKSLIDTLLPKDRDDFAWDTEIPGFGVKITPKGNKSFIYQYRLYGRSGSTRRLKIGDYGKPWTLHMARKEAKSHMGAVARNIDPQTERDAAKARLRVKEVASLFLEHHVSSLKPRTQTEYKRVFTTYCPRPFLNKYVDEVRKQDIESLRNGLKDNPYGANRALRVLSCMFNWAFDNDYRLSSSNPCTRVSKYHERKVERYLSPDEIHRLGAVLKELDESDPRRIFQIAAIRLLLLTGARLMEILSLKWEYIKLTESRIYLPDSKINQAVIPLNPNAVAVLKSLPKLEGNPFVICGAKSGQHLVNLQKAWRMIRTKADLSDVRLHDLRHSFASVGVNEGYSLAIIGNLLGHKSQTTTQRYAHLANTTAVAATEHVGGNINQHLGVVPSTT